MTMSLFRHNKRGMQSQNAAPGAKDRQWRCIRLWQAAADHFRLELQRLSSLEVRWLSSSVTYNCATACRHYGACIDRLTCRTRDKRRHQYEVTNFSCCTCMRERGLCLRRKFTKIFTVTKLNGLGCCNVKVFSVVASYGASPVATCPPSTSNNFIFRFTP